MTQGTFAWISVGGWIAVVVAAATLRGRAYATFRGVLLLIHGLIATALMPHVGELWPVWLYLHLSIYVSSLMLSRPRMRSLPYRLFVSWPEAFFGAGTMLALPWAVAAAFGATPHGFYVAYALAAIGLLQSFRRGPNGAVDVVVADGQHVDGVQRHRASDHRTDRPLNIMQITDPHLGAFMSVTRLAAICQSVVERDPDLVFLTGDFLTMESQSDPKLLATALAPLAALKGRVFACFGNHDLEAPDTVREALKQIGATLLVDDAVVVDTPVGRVQVVGADFVWRARRDHLLKLCSDHPRVDGALRILLLHDPGAFKHVPEGEADLVLSGHTHGGQVGLVSLGLPGTFMSLFSAPDHGLWARGTDRMYIHRGTGHYGFPVRLGVPAEESLLRVH